MKKNDIAQLLVTSQSNSDGSGVGDVDGFVLFIPGGVVGDRLKVKVLKVGKSYGFAKIIDILEPSPFRVVPSCPVYGRCGGCSLMHVAYNAQLSIKKQFVHDALTRIGGITDVQVHDTIGMENPLHYRNKAQYPVCQTNTGFEIGFYATKSHRLIPIRQCLIVPKWHKNILDAVENWMKLNNISGYNELTHAGQVRHIYLRHAHATNEIMLSIITNSNKKLQNIEQLCCLPNIVGIVQCFNTKKGNVILGERHTTLFGRDYVNDILLGKRIKVSHNSFYQVNSYMAEKLYSHVCGQISGCVYELYSGIGALSLSMLDSADYVTGVEIVPDAVCDAEYNARLNCAQNIDFINADVIDYVSKLNGNESHIVIDPPRKGVQREVLTAMMMSGAEKITYISCDPATLARDCKLLSEGYDICHVMPFDMFPHTHHVETVVLMKKR